jgi:hypothetical protein
MAYLRSSAYRGVLDGAFGITIEPPKVFDNHRDVLERDFHIARIATELICHCEAHLIPRNALDTFPAFAGVSHADI